MTSNADLLIARKLRLAVVFDQYKQGNISESEAIELMSGELSPGDPSTKIDDGDLMKLLIKTRLKVLNLE